MPNARTSANYDAFSTYLNVNGLSHGKIANTSCEKYMRTSKALESDHNSIKKKIMKEPWNMDIVVEIFERMIGKCRCAQRTL